MDGGELTAGLHETFAIFAEADRPREPRTTNEVSQELDISRRSTYDRLTRLADRGLLETKKVGARGRVWWIGENETDDPKADGSGVVAAAGREGPGLAGPLADSLFENQRDVVYAVDDEGEFVRWNDRLVAVTGYADDELAGMHVLDLIAEEAHDEAMAALQAVVRDGETRTLEVPVVTAGGERIPYEVSGSPVRDHDGQIVGLTGVGRDVSDRKHKERELERERDEVVRELEDVFERVDDAFFALDGDWQFTYVNDRAAEVLDSPAHELLGESIWEAFPEAVGSTFAEEYRRAVETQESVTFEEYFPPLSAWFEVSAYPSANGLSVYFRDVTDRKERERDLEQYEALAQTATDVIVTIDADSVIQDVNPAVADVFGYEPEALVGESLATLVLDDYVEGHVDALAEYLDGGDRTLDWEYVELPGERADGTEIPLAISFSEYEYDDERYFAGIVRDESEREARERDLERFEAVVQTMSDGVYVMDEAGSFVMVNDAFAEMTGYDRSDLLGTHGSRLVDDETIDRVRELEGEMARGERETARVEATVERSDGEEITAEATFALLEDDDGSHQRVAVVRDVTERRERERALEESRRRYRTLVENFPNGAVGLVDDDLRYVTVGGRPIARNADDAADLERERVREVLPPDIAETFATSYEAALDGEADSFELEEDGRHVQVRIFPVQDGNGDVFAAMGMSQDVTEQREYERQLVRQREQLSALNDLHEVVNGVTDAVLSQSTRDEIERTACERLVKAESYELAWIAEADPRTGSVTRRVEAGIDGYLDGVDLSVDGGEATGRGPAGVAFRTGEIQVSRDASSDSTFEPWRDAAREYGFSAFAAIPVVHGGTQYGVLGLATEREGAFAEAERAVVGQLGEVIGHAIAAAERKRALMSEEVVQIEFRVPGIFDALGVDVGPVGRIAFDQTVPIGDDEFLVYGHASADAVETLRTLVDRLGHWASVGFRGEGDPVEFELRLSEPPVLSTLAALGGSVENAVIADGDYRMVLQVPSDADIQRLVKVVTDAYGTAELMTRRQLTRRDESTGGADEVVAENLTERQLASLRAAFHAGFFEWPRETSGEDLAASMDVAPPTFHQHLRKAEKKVFESLFGD